MNELGGRAYWITGKSGTGKTTIAKIIANKIAGESTNILETTGRELTKSIIDTWLNQYRIYGKPFVGNGYALIVNESHGLNKTAIEIMLNILEELPDYVTFIFTTTLKGDDLFEEQLDNDPFKSRCIFLKLAQRGKGGAYIDLCYNIALKECLFSYTTKDIEQEQEQELKRKIKIGLRDNNYNLRTVITSIESGYLL